MERGSSRKTFKSISGGRIVGTLFFRAVDDEEEEDEEEEEDGDEIKF
tara:strand:- start:287 stop:427 length:141 start_codon:yes stop_codon:yes gene_type:complete